MRWTACGERSRKPPGEPTLHGRGRDRGQALLPHRLDAVVPHRLVSKIGRRVGEDELVDALGRHRPEPHPDHAAHGQPAPVDSLDPERVQDRQHVAPKPLHRVGTSGTARPAMSAPVISHKPEGLGKGLHLVVPHTIGGAERVRQHQHGRTFATLNLDMDRTAIDVNDRHSAFAPPPDTRSASPTFAHAR